jgi:anti-sigma regulatory factor (Ser/Thr protein kinase)
VVPPVFVRVLRPEACVQLPANARRARVGAPRFRGHHNGNHQVVPQDLSPLAQVEVRCDQTAPRVVRQALTTLDSLDRVLGDLLLIASELVTNAVLYSGCSERDMIQVQLVHRGDHLLLSVTDPVRSSRSAALAVAEQRSFGGRGLWLVEHLARRWGAERAKGDRVWAEVPLSEPVE